MVKVDRELYKTVMDQMEDPKVRRQGLKIKNKRGKEIIARRVHLTSRKMAEKVALKKATGADYINPFRVGAYWGAIEALGRLGVNQWWSLKTIREKMQEIMSKMPCKTTVSAEKYQNLWDQFENKLKPVQDKDGKDILVDYKLPVTERIKMNFLTMQRRGAATPYGLALIQCCQCIDIKWDNFVFYYRLNTTFNSPGEVEPILLSRSKPKKRLLNTSQSETQNSSPTEKKILGDSSEAPNQEDSDLEVQVIEPDMVGEPIGSTF